MEEADLEKSDYVKNRIRRRSQSHTRKSHLDRLINKAEARRDIVNALYHHRLSSSSTAAASGTVRNTTSQNFYQLMESMPIPEPTWSTTAPTVLCAPVPSVEVLEFEWPENMSSSHSWWIGFLNSLDGKENSELIMENSKGCGQISDNSSVEKPYLDANDDDSPFLDEWLIFPAAEDHDEQV
ncbi:Uncharacterized protein Adt_32236 [Abeliophyllum distichum]|uniref:Uncharacterized protein n=1 Tax=Abeliophyllum distichum TaxID=126358 RepID=A0ABD1QST6_9LAMI